MNKEFFVYVIKSIEGLFYIGMTEDIDNRLLEHNNKSKSFWTKRGNDWKLIYKESFDSKIEASKREKWLKSGYGLKYLKEIGVK